VDDTAVTAVDHTEGVALTDDGGSDVTFGQKSLDSYGFDTEFVRFSLELARDSVLNMEALLGSLLGERLGRIANLQLTTADGSSKPHGVVHASSLGKTAASQTAMTMDELIDLEHSVDPAYRSRRRCASCSTTLTLSAIRKLKDGNGQLHLADGRRAEGRGPGRFSAAATASTRRWPSIATGNKT
jgi:HK97 family phage major capsid protein